MSVWTAIEAQKATNGRLVGNSDWESFGISIDSRIVKKGDLFIALKGTKTDGHDYLREAFLKGASVCMVEKLPQNFPNTSPLLVVDNCIEALYRLARYRREESKAKIIAVTGSVGKTSTKEMLNLAFANFGISHATIGNNNNDIGAPLTVARMPREADFGIFELGMNHANEISPLSKLVKPHIAIITTVEEAHLEFFKSVEGIAEAKAEIFDGLDREGTAILNADNPFFDFLAKRAKKIKNIISFGTSERADVRLLSFRDSINSAQVTASVFGRTISYQVSAQGKHMALNSLATLAAVGAAGENVVEAANSLTGFSVTAGRGQIRQLAIAGKKITLIDDSYNASPVSMRAALDNLGAIESRGRKIAILGDMLEMGERSAQLHESLAADVLRNNIDVVFTVGQFSRLLFDKLPEKIRGIAAEHAEELLPLIENSLQADDVILIKASHGIRLGKIADALSKVKENAI